jgi:DNA invertase Pin-like site-specific DNA recombinase
MTSRTYGYRRVSSQQQSYDRQTAALIKYGIPEKFIYEDKLSGKSMDRAGFEDLLDQVREGDTIVVTSLDRFGRTTVGILETIERLTAQGVAVKSLKAGEDFTGITGKLILTMMAAIAEWERENTKERAADARAAKAANGTKTERKATVLLPAKVEAVKALRAAGKTIDYIVKNQGMSRASVYRALAENQK